MTIEEGHKDNVFQLPRAGRTNKPINKTTVPEPLASYIFPDIRALHEIRLETFVHLTYEEITVHGFEIYIVEQWAAERKVSTVITSYTGNSQDTINAVQVVLPKNPERWPGKLREYYEDLSIFAKARSMPKGSLFITNLATVPSTLNLLHVECGDIRVIWKDFEVNFDLKKLRCGGRSALLLCGTSAAAEDKFRQLYKISIESSERERQLEELGQYEHFSQLKQNYNPVIELITMVQICLSYFNLYHDMKDGLLCDKTEAAVARFWQKYGKYYFGIDRPRNEGTSGPATVAALISLVLSCYFKLQVEDCISSKDPFEADEFFGGIYTFQKKYGLTRGTNPVYLDDLTLQRLFEVSAKTSNSDIFKFKKVVKSTVSDITGKGNPMHLSNEILTTDLDALVRKIHGGSLGLLWKSKGRLRKNFYKDYDNFCEIRYARGNPKAVLDKQANQMRSDGSESQESSSDEQGKHVFDTNLARYNTSSSSVSASSMFCNYDKANYASNFNINKLYHGEYFRRNSSPLLFNESSDQESLPPDEQSHGLYRANSFSDVQDVVEAWSLPFDPSLVKMARDLLKLHNQIQSQEREKKSNQGCMRGDEDLHAGHEGHYKVDFEQEDHCRADFEHLISHLQNNHQLYSHRVKELENNHKEVENKQLLLHGEMRELSSLASKFKYDMGILDIRMRDVEESISQFDKKLAAVQKSLVDQGLGTALGSELLVDKEQLEKCLQDFLQAENTKYEGVCCRVCSKKYFKQLHNDFKAWTSWTINRFFNRGEIPNTQKNI
ncbi:STB6 (YKL072W) and STB2 (YMR053C) [Zygosaccharomyces parabailii]|nr:STB6 (YKL072W) and STB2 (YMR053C) [Zygosaccharomyces parabailii]CDH12205.1 related to Protein STB6 [Zygosaccharomyces bailii ISA1307]